ncbi:MAG: hypothetical protein KDD62_02320, partial [Bdellovibrionales bacterium]|nr:hypothetical protein [Bdellovibrionales bacterium]
RDYLTKLLGLLSSQNAEVLMLREMHGFSYGEVANICDCTVDAIKSRLKRARKEIVEKATLLNLDLEKEPVSHETL